MGRGGKLESHLERVRDVVLRWLEFKDKEAKLDEAQKDDPLVRLSIANGDPDPEIPEPLEMFYLMKNLNLPYRSGGLENQPYVLVRELSTVANALVEHERHKELAQALEELFNAESPEPVHPTGTGNGTQQRF